MKTAHSVKNYGKGKKLDALIGRDVISTVTFAKINYCTAVVQYITANCTRSPRHRIIHLSFRDIFSHQI